MNADVRPLAIRIVGPDPAHEKHEREQSAKGSNVGWSTDDIEFRKDGVIVIKNPYLANAIERFLKENKENNRSPFRLIRENVVYSGPPVDLVCEP